MMDKNIDIEEKIDVVNHFTQQLVNSGYNDTKIKEIVISSLKGIVRKEKKRIEDGQSRYRSAEESLMDRLNKKLLEATTWYKDTKNYEETAEDKAIEDILNPSRNAWKECRIRERMGNNEVRKRKRKKLERENIDNHQKPQKITAVIFVQHTPHSELTKRMRSKLDSLEKLGKFKIKLVERAGTKVVDILHQSNAWSMMDCERKDCLICNTESSKKGSCKRRNVLYETFCITCQNEREERERKYGEEVEVDLQIEMDEDKDLEGANQIETKNPIDDVMENEVNDTPVIVETKNEIMKASQSIEGGVK